MPVQKSLRRHNRGKSLELVPTDLFGLGRQPTPLVVVEPGPSTQLSPQDPVPVVSENSQNHEQPVRIDGSCANARDVVARQKSWRASRVNPFRRRTIPELNPASHGVPTWPVRCSGATGSRWLNDSPHEGRIVVSWMFRRAA